MSISSFYDRVAHTMSGTPGTGVITLGEAATSYQSLANVGAPNGAILSYCLIDGTNWEIGQGTYSSSGPTFTRTTIEASSNSGSAISATSNAIVSIVLRVSDLATCLDKNRYAPPLAADFPTLLATASINPNVYYTPTSGFTLGSGLGLTGTAVRGAFKTISGSSWTVTTRMRALINPSTNYQGGYLTLKSSTGQLIMFGFQTLTSISSLIVTWFNSNTSFNANKINSDFSVIPEWLQIVYNGTTFSYQYSMDGTNWIILWSESSTGLFSAAPTGVGFTLYCTSTLSGMPTTSPQTDLVLLNVLYYNDPTLTASTRTVGVLSG